MPLEAFDSSAKLFDVLNGGVNSADRVLLNGQRNIQTNVLQSIETSFASRIDAAIAQLNKSSNIPKVDALRREHSLLVSRKSRVNTAIELLDKTLTQTASLKSVIERLQGQVKGVIDGTVTSINAATEWDNKLRKINILVEDATVTHKDQGNSYEINLIKSNGSRTSFPTQTFNAISKKNPTQSFSAPLNSNGETLFIDGIYLGTDYFLEETNILTAALQNDNTFWNSDTAFLSTEAATGTLSEFTSKAGFPNSPTGQSGSVLGPLIGGSSPLAIFDYASPRNVNGTQVLNNSLAGADTLEDSVIWLDIFSGEVTTNANLFNGAKVTKGGLGLLDAWLYGDFAAQNAFGDSITAFRTRALKDLGEAMSKIVFAEKQFSGHLKTLQSQTNFFDPLINSLDQEISNLTKTALDEKQAIVTSLELQSQVAQFNSSLLEARGNTLVFSLILAQDTLNKSQGAFQRTGEALFGLTLNIQV